MSGAQIHIAHVIYALKTGGLENGLVNLINRLPPERYLHTIICLTDYDDFAHRIQREDVKIHALHKRDGQDFGMFIKLFRLFRSLRPDIVHTRNLATIEAQIPAWLAGVPVRIHGEHGWDRNDPDGQVKKYQWLRRFCSCFIQHFIALSGSIHEYLEKKVGIKPQRITRICNGVDTKKFTPANNVGKTPSHPFNKDDFIIGYVGRMEAVKDPLNLVHAFIQLHKQNLLTSLRLIMIGDGPERSAAEDLLKKSGLSDSAWLPGGRSDVMHLMQSFDVYVLPSMAEGISNTLLEAMSSGLPVVATRVGGNSELILEGETGVLVDRLDSEQLARGIQQYLDDSSLQKRHAQAARQRALKEFSLDGMVKKYDAIYQAGSNGRT